jgi:rhodanese-related sulfurtransferase
VSAIDRLLADVRASLPRRPTADELPALRARHALIVDIRPVELRAKDGALEGATVVDRNQLEWRLDPSSEHRLVEATGRDVEIVLVCDEGYASSLAAATLQQLGLRNATDLDGGYQAALAAGTA